MRYFMDVIVRVHWDEDAEVWVAICDELGISLESGSYDALLEKIKVTVPEMIEANGIADVKSVKVSTTDILLS
ncbi:MAG: DUF1902 domain-containing protein [Lachnospiraceae bacterium]|nr:DUF1902 domain-containing protein [Lachnospiraceae bacterium]